MLEKITRICWNSNEWKNPSGAIGKSKDQNSFEVERGYGHEEWLQDFDKLIDGFKYSFLQGLNTKNHCHQDETYSIWLYTMQNQRKICIGKINNAECLTQVQASEAVSQYRKKSWFNEMANDLDILDINSSLIIENEALFNFNVRFKPEDFDKYARPIDITDTYRNDRYVLLNRLSDSDVLDDQNTLTSDLLNIIEGSLESDRDQLIKARIGQGKFRKNVANEWGGEKCAVTLIDIKEMLIASHIKPWKDCNSSSERLDGANGLLLCAHIDRLFDNHMLTFIRKRNGYYLEIQKDLDLNILKRLGIDSGIELDLYHLKNDARSRFDEYMKHHNQLFLNKS